MSCTNTLADNLRRFIGETVTIFTTSGGCSGRGFTGVLITVTDDYVRLITRIGPAPTCPFGNRFSGYGGYGGGYGGGSGGCLNNIGSAAEIPIDRIASFVHNTVNAFY